MEVTKDEIKEPRTLSREQKRFLEKIENEAKGIFQSLADKFLIEFVECDDPAGEHIKETANRLDAQWKVYVKRRKLDPKALTALRLYIDDTFKEYEGSKTVKENEGSRQSCVKCICDCGTIKEYKLYSLKKGTTKSCGCLHKEGLSKIRFIHGDVLAFEYRVWGLMKARCNPANKDKYYYRYWSGRGISVCDRWLKSYQNFLSDMGRAPSPKHSIDRINNNGNYEPLNCRWATRSEQNSNRREMPLRGRNEYGPKITYKGITKYTYDWAKEFKIKPYQVTKRIKRGWSVEDALNTPIGHLNETCL